MNYIIGVLGNINRLIGLISLVVCCVNCTSNQNNISGIYKGVNYGRTRDTLKIYDNGIYEQLIYLNEYEKNKLIYSNKSKWSLSGSKILFENFLINNNEIDPKINYDKRDLINAFLEIEKSFKSIKIIENYDKSLHYKKIYRGQ